MSTIRHFFKWAQSMGYTNKIMPSLIQSPKATRTKINPLSDYELQAILTAPALFEYNEIAKLRNLLLFQVGYYLGLRISEALAVTFKELLNTSQNILITGKGRKQRTLYIPNIVQETAYKYQRLRESLDTVELRITHTVKKSHFRRCECVDPNPHLPFISLQPSTYGNPLRKASVSPIFRKYEKLI